MSKFLIKPNLQKLFIFIVSFALLVVVYFIFPHNSKESPANQRPVVEKEERLPLEKALTVTDQNLVSIPVFKKVVESNSKNISRVFFRISSGIAFKCGQFLQKCALETAGPSNLDLSAYASILNSYSIPMALIYDLNIDNYKYRFETFRTTAHGNEIFKQQDALEKTKAIFSNPEYRNAILKDLSSKLKILKFDKIIFGSELNFYFYNVWGTKTRRAEIESFWSLIKQIKSENPDLPISTSFNYEHLKYYNFWGELGVGKLVALDFVALSSYPLHPGWSLFPKFDEQLCSFNSKGLDIEKFNYYSMIRQKLFGVKSVYFIDFGYPLDESQEQNRLLLIQHLKDNPAIRSVSWALTSVVSGDTPESRFHNSLSIVDEKGDLNVGGKFFFAEEKLN
jgi:hypothetical protein